MCNIDTSPVQQLEVDDGSSLEESSDNADLHKEVESDSKEGADESCGLIHENQYDTIRMPIEPTNAPLPAPAGPIFLSLATFSAWAMSRKLGLGGR